ncbi:MAG: HAD-IIIA family hydrolase [Bacteroidales bacterium]|nr:HAD-IIIA family hydrolase [Bacteroidales bacterium]
MDTDRSLFLDRDGIVNHRIVDGYVTKPEDFIFKTDFLETMERIAPRFKKIFIMTNQQGVGKGLMTMEQVNEVHRFMCAELDKRKIHIEKVYVCPHLASENCSCRKPKNGLALQAQNDYPEIDFSRSVMIGDALSDLKFGRNCGMKTVFVNDSHLELTDEIVNSADVIVNSMSELTAI